MIKLISAYWRGFVGGPDFTRSINHRFILEDKLLSVSIPDSNVAAVPSVIDVSFPHTSTSWFKQHTKIYDQHQFVRIITENWMYMPPIAFAPSSEYGMLTCQLRIKQTDKINVQDKHALAEFVIQQYDDFHNGPEGKNTQIRKEITEQSSKRATPWSPDELEEEIAGWIENRGKPPIPQAQIKRFNQTDWVFYQESKSNRYTHINYYCLPLSPTSFLEVKFNCRVDLNHKFKKWSQHAQESQERIMASIQLTNIEAEQDHLLHDLDTI